MWWSWLWRWRWAGQSYVSPSYLRELDRLDSRQGWIYPTMPRWKSPKEVAQERRAARRSEKRTA